MSCLICRFGVNTTKQKARFFALLAPPPAVRTPFAGLRLVSREATLAVALGYKRLADGFAKFMTTAETLVAGSPLRFYIRHRHFHIHGFQPFVNNFWAFT